ncbi:MAG TPA: acyl-CoA dehydrogenase family protein [Actinokineospora sp.]|jgi:hypothetical protein|nr:acyl-CoA dehydrogenase family protein [Actinokineospora sp.]
MHSTIQDCERTAMADGLAAGLTMACDAVGGVTAPGRVAALPLTRIDAGTPVLPHWLAQAEGVGFVRTPDCPDAPVATLTAFGVLLGAVRLGVTRRLAERAVEHLSGRTAGGEPTIRKQLVLGVLADVLTATEALRRCLQVAAGVPAAVTDVHDRLTELDWESAKLLGANGFITDSPTRAAYVSRLVANCWVPR